jgi:hypothetical protein
MTKVHLEFVDEYTLPDTLSQATKLFVFGDNMERRGTGKSSGQAVIRSAANAFGIVTKRAPATSSDAYFSDKADEFSAMKGDFANLVSEIKSGKWEAVVFPAAGLGTGRSQLKEKSPKLWAFIPSPSRKPSRSGLGGMLLLSALAIH